MNRLVCLGDTDILIDVSRGNKSAINFVDTLTDSWSISVITALELIVGAKNSREVAEIDHLIAVYQVVPVNERIGGRAFALLRRYARSHGLRTFDSLIAATALEEGYSLATMNRKHFGMIEELILNVPRY